MMREKAGLCFEWLKPPIRVILVGEKDMRPKKFFTDCNNRASSRIIQVKGQSAMILFCMMPAIQNEMGAESNTAVDESLLSRIAAGDREAFAAFYHQTDRAVYGFALSILKNRQDAEDIMQDTYLRILDAAASYQPRGKPLAWVLTIARNLALMRLRAADRTRPEDPEIMESGFSSAEDGTESALDRLVLRGALSHLADQERQIVILHAVTGMKHREIAQLLQQPLPTVLSKYTRALARLQKWMNGGARK
jgi:RNA polymerase sigma factor (sigma-70 family)